MSREPRPAHPEILEPANNLIVAAIVFTFFATAFLLVYQRSLYFDAGVRGVDLLGAIAGLMLTALALSVPPWLYWRGHGRTTVVAAAVPAGFLALALALLPPIVAGVGWVTIVLAVLLAVVVDLTWATWAVFATGYLVHEVLAGDAPEPTVPPGSAAADTP